MNRVHATAIDLAVPGPRAFAFMADRAKLDRWSFGTWKTTLHDDGMTEGRALFDDAVTWVRIDADAARGVIDYHLGAKPDALMPRIMARVVPGAVVGLDANHCVLTLIAWRGAAMDDARWRRLTAAHEFEIVLLKSLIERD